jgi:hypothetical protein
MLSVSTLNPASSRRCTFSLEILFISGCLDVMEWIRDQESLKGIGLFVDWRQELSQFTVYRALLDDPNPHRLFGLWSVLDEGTPQTTVYVFPSFSPQWSAKPIWDSLMQMEYPGRVWSLKLYLTCLSDGSTLRSVLASIAQYFPHIYYLEFILHDQNIHLVRVFSSNFNLASRSLTWDTHRILAECRQLCH